MKNKPGSLYLLLLLGLLSSPLPLRVSSVPKLYSPDLVLAAKEEEAKLQHLNVYHRRCNKSMYDATSYKKAWDHANKNDYSTGAELFNNFVTIARKGRDAGWRQNVCDGWPYSLFECAEHPSKNITICQCLKTHLTKFQVERSLVFSLTDNVTLTVCRVQRGFPCHTKSSVLHCSESMECVSQTCGSGHLVLFLFPILFSVVVGSAS